jgi:hypothetical protein
VAFWTLVTAIAGGLLAGVVWSRSFTSTAQLIRYEPSSIDDSYRPGALSAPSLVVMLQAPGLLEEVGSHLQPPITAKQLAERLEITLDRNNDLVTVTATGGSREQAVDTVNRFCVAAIAYTQTIQRQEATDAGDNLNHQLAEVENEVAITRKAIPADSEAALAAIASGSDQAEASSDLPVRIQAVREQLEDLLSRYTDAHPLVREQRRDTLSPSHATAARPLPLPAAPPVIYNRFTLEEVALGERLRPMEAYRALLIERQQAIQPFRDNPPGYFRVLLSATANPTQLQRYRLQIVLFAYVTPVSYGSKRYYILGTPLAGGSRISSTPLILPVLSTTPCAMAYRVRPAIS